MRKEEKTSALIISIVNCFRINLESINQIVRAAKAGGSISKHSTYYQFHAVARFLAKLTPTDGRTDTIDRATATINSSLKSAAEHFGNVSRECYISVSSTRSARKYRGAIRKGVGAGHEHGRRGMLFR